jgi:nitrite reductase/ring-hydroxylating ferredoxin subunit
MTEILVGAVEDFPDNDGRVLAIGGFEVGVFRFGDELVAWENHCPHAAGPACQGKVFRKVGETIAEDRTSQGMYFSGEHQIVCPWHGFEFNLRTGRHPGDGRYRLRPVPLTVRNDSVFLELPDLSSAAA